MPEQSYTPPELHIALKARPNIPTDGYRYVRHNTEPMPADISFAATIAVEFLAWIEQLDEPALRLLEMRMEFERSHTPGEMSLHAAVVFVFDRTGSRMEARGTDHYLCVPHMRDTRYLLKELQNSFLESLRNLSSETLRAGHELERIKMKSDGTQKVDPDELRADWSERLRTT